MVPFYVLQQYNNGIGNFINCTPAIIGLYKKFSEPIPVLFQRREVAEMFSECPYIQRIDNISEREMIFSSSFVNQDIPDWLYLYLCVIGVTTNDFSSQRDMPHTYVDRVARPDEVPESNYVVFLRGCFAPNQYSFKDPGDQVYLKALTDVVEAGKLPVFLGNSEDYERGIRQLLAPAVKEYVVILDDVRKSLGAIRHADFVIANDTGFYHAAAALRKSTFVFWKDTNWKKNRAPGSQTFYSFKENWEDDWNKWISSTLS